MRQFVYQLKQAFLSLKNKLGFVATVVTTMGTTIGALLCVLTMGYLLLVEPLPYPQQERLYTLQHHLIDSKDVVNATAFTYPGLIHLYKNEDVFETSALAYYNRDVLTSLPHQPTLNTLYITPEWFKLLNVKPLLGRSFEDSEALDSFNPVAIISYDTWQEDFEGIPNILEQKVSFSGVSFNIVGVLDKDFVEPQIAQTGRESGVWMPWDYNLNSNARESWGSIDGSLTFVGSLKPSVTSTQAEQILSPIINDVWRENVAGVAFFNGWTIDIDLLSFKSAIVGDSESTVYKLLVGVIGLVFIALANVVNLFMSRTAEQQRQLSIYAALGAKKSQLFKGLFAESFLLMLLSLLTATVIASAGFKLLKEQLSTELARVNELSINGFTLLIAVGLILLCATIFAYLSSKMINYRKLNSNLQSSGKGTGIQVSKCLRQSLIVIQVAIASALVFVNITLFSDALQTITKDNGFSIDNMTQVSISISSPELPTEEQQFNDIQALIQQFESLPQVLEVSNSRSVLDNYGIWALTAVESEENFTPQSKEISHNYFTLTGQQLLEGDNFSKADIKDGNMVMIVNDVFAEQLNPNGSVVGMQISANRNEPSFTIIGVVKTANRPAIDNMPMRVFTPASRPTPTMTLKLVAGQEITREDVVNVIKSVSNQYALFRLLSLERQKGQMLFTQYTTVITTAVLAFITLFLAGVGLYGILSYGTQMRRFELGTRMAIGAKRTDLVVLIIKDNLGVIVLGFIFSIAATLGIYLLNQELVSSYVNVELIGIFAITLISILTLSLFACYWPLRQFINKPAIHSLRGSE